MSLTPLPYSLPPDGGLASTGHSGLDRLMDKLRLGDNVVWHVDDLEEYRKFARMFWQQAVKENRPFVYVRFGKEAPILPTDDATIQCTQLNPEEGFDCFSRKVNELATQQGRGAYYVFDCLSELLTSWGTEEMLANFFQTACPYLYELRTIAYFGLLRGRHTNQTIARIYNTTQVFVELFGDSDEQYLKLVKVWDRYSSQMFFPHRIEAESIVPLFDRLRPHMENAATRQPSIRDTAAEVSMLLGDHPAITRMAERFLKADALAEVRKRLIGSGRIGGKSVGILLANQILRDPVDGLSDPLILDENDSCFIGSDVYYSFLVQNQLFRLRMERMNGDPSQARESFAQVEQRFLQGTFPPDRMEQFRRMLKNFGTSPIIVRSSSLLEDSFGGAFAGKYRSEFCANQGSPEDRLQQLTNAVKLVYSSTLSPDALSYRKRRGLDQREELMAVLIQRVAGSQYKNYFFPTLAGVAFSRNLYAWNDRIDPAQGMIRLVFGLGTRAVDRVDIDYPRMIAVSHPLLRPEVGTEAAKYSQHEMDVINLHTNRLETLPVSDVLENANYPGLHLLVSAFKDDHLEEPFSKRLDPSSHYVLTFNNLIRQTKLVKALGESLSLLEKTYDQPVDIEFAAGITPRGELRLSILQCRPLWTQEASACVSIPNDIDPTKVLFRAHRVITGGLVESIRFIIYVDPKAYQHIDYPSDRKMLGRIVGKINSHPDIAPLPFILIGPGRWGSSNAELGVNVSYADIDNTNVLVELSGASSRHSHEVSYGTHFFQDLVEERIIYLPVFSELPESSFNHSFFANSPNSLSTYLPDYETLAANIKLIDLQALGLRAQLIADAQNQEAICHLL